LVGIEFLTTIRATVASNGRIWLVAIGNQTCKNSDVISHQLTHRVRHGTGNVVLVKSKGSHLGTSADRLWCLTSKHVGVQLHVLHFRKDSNVIDATRKTIVVEIQLGQTAQGKDTIWHPGKVGEFVGALLVVGKAEGDQLGTTEIDGWALDKDGSSDGMSVGSEDGV
jgi:hypothetical protein